MKLSVLILTSVVLIASSAFGAAGNVNNDNTVDLKDVIMSLQVCAGLTPVGVSTGGDANNNGRIGLEEAVYGLQIVSGLRTSPVNHAPVLTSIGSKTVNENSILTFTINATDPDGNALTYSATGLPSGATFNASSRTFTWTPGTGTAGNYNVTFTVKDNATPPMSASEKVAITVNPTPLQNCEGHWKSEAMSMAYGSPTTDKGYLDININSDGSFSGITGAYVCLVSPIDYNCMQPPLYLPCAYSCFHFEGVGEVQASGTIDFVKSTGTIGIQGITYSFTIITNSKTRITFKLDNNISGVVKQFVINKAT